MTETTLMPATTGPESPFRWRLTHRPDLWFGHAAGGVAGVLVAAAILAFVIEVTDEDATIPGVGFNLLLIAAAVAVGFFVRGPVRSAAVAALVLAIPQFWAFAVVGDGEGFDRGDFRVILLLSVVTYLAFYLLTWTRGRAILLGLALLLFTNWIVFEVADQSTPFGVGSATQVTRGFEGPRQLGLDDGKQTETGVTEVILAAVLLGGAVVLDRRGRVGAATPLLFVGGLQAVSAAAVLGADVDDVYAAGVFVAIAGLVIGLAGTLGRRRGTSWVGAAVLLVGALVVVVNGTNDAANGKDGSGAAFGAFALVAAAVLLLIGVLVARAVGEPLDGGEPIPVAPPAPEPEPEPALVAATAETPAETPAETTAEPPSEPPAAAEKSWAEPTPDESPPPESPPPET
jgi:hypothetical protein